MNRLVLIAACLAALILPASADDAEYKAHVAGCAQGNQEDVAALASLVGGVNIVRLSAGGLASATAFYNNFPPESNDTFDYAWAVDAQNGAGFLILAAAKGECVGHFIAREAWPRVKAIVLGTSV